MVRIEFGGFLQRGRKKFEVGLFFHELSTLGVLIFLGGVFGKLKFI